MRKTELNRDSTSSLINLFYFYYILDIFLIQFYHWRCCDQSIKMTNFINFIKLIKLVEE